MIKVNLIPPEYIAKQKQRAQFGRIISVAVVGVLMLFALTGVHIRSAYRAEALLKEKEAKLRELQAKVDKVKELETIKSSVQAHLDALNGLLQSRFYYPNFMQDLAKSLSPTIWFSSINTTLLSGGRIDFSTNAMARTGEDLAAWYNTLETDPRFASPAIGAISINGAGTNKTFSFPIKATYIAPLR